MTIDGDIVRLVQVLQNLLDNAAKYTPERGRVELVAGLSGREVEIEVRDNGAGIPASLLPEVFDLFRQGEQVQTVRRAGSASVSPWCGNWWSCMAGAWRRIAPGSAKAPASPSGCPRPSTRRKDSSPTEDGPAPARRLRVLVVDDDVAVAESTAMLLRWKATKSAARIRAKPRCVCVGSFSPQAVLLDIGLPGQDGYEIARKIRESARRSGDEADRGERLWP